MKPQIKCFVCPRARFAAMVRVLAARRNDWRAAALRLHNAVSVQQRLHVGCPLPELVANWRAPHESANPRL